MEDSKIMDPGTKNFFIELQNKTSKSKKSLTSKHDKIKYPFTYFFPLKDYWTFFLESRFVS